MAGQVAVTVIVFIACCFISASGWRVNPIEGFCTAGLASIVFVLYLYMFGPLST